MFHVSCYSFGRKEFEEMENLPDGADSGSWTFLSNHAHVLVCLARDPDVRLREVAVAVGITERAVFKIVTELEAAGVIRRSREGRRNHYDINRSAKLRHPLEAARSVGSLLDTLNAGNTDTGTDARHRDSA